MRTDELIRAMAADTLPRKPVGAVLLGALAGAAAVVTGVALAVLGPNPDLAALWRLPSLMLLRQVFPLLLAVGAAAVAVRLARPGADAGPGRLLLLAAVVLASLVVGRELARVPAVAWRSAMMGESGLPCLVLIALFALPLLGAALWALRRGASTRPRVSGALAGLMAGAIASAIYALHCTEMSPLFYAAWYGLAVLGVTMLGALVGPRLLRW